MRRPGGTRGESPPGRAHPRSATPGAPRPHLGPPPPGCQRPGRPHLQSPGRRGSPIFFFSLSLVFLWVVALEEFGEISGALAWLGFPKSTLQFRWSLLSLTRQGPIM